MVAARPCPKPEEFQKLTAKAGETRDIEQLAQHLENCEHCSRVVERLLARDLLSVALLSPDVPRPRQDEKTLDQLMQQLKQLPGRRDPLGTDGTIPESQHTPLNAPTTAARLDFLAAAERPDEIGRLGGYRVLKVLGSGGMGLVLQAEDVKLGRPVALKVMRPDVARKPHAAQRFLREARAAAALRHDNIVTIYQVGEDRGVPFLAMEFLEGAPLDKWLDQGRELSAVQILRIGRQVAGGLAAAHDKGLIHRDIKPANLWLDKVSRRVKILDFGLARDQAENLQLTQSGDVLGTPAFMAPEQARGDKVDARSDLFSLGCVLYRLCTGRLPFTGTTAMAILIALAMDTPPSVRELNAGIPVEFAELIMRLLAKDPANRPESAREVVQTLRAIERQLASQPVAATAATVPDDPEANVTAALPRPKEGPAPATSENRAITARGWTQRQRVLIAAGVLVALMALLAAGVVIIGDRFGKKVEEISIADGGSVESKEKSAKLSRNPFDSMTKQVPEADRFPHVVGVLENPGKEITALALSNDDRLLAIGFLDGQARIYRLFDDQSPVLKRKTKLSAGAVRALAFSPKEDKLFVVRENGTIVWNLQSKPPVDELHLKQPGKRKNVSTMAISGTQVAVSPDGKMFAVVAWNVLAGCWDLGEADPKDLFALNSVYLYSYNVFFTPNGQGLLLNGLTQGVELWDLTAKPPTAKKLVMKAANPVALSPDGKTLAVRHVTREDVFGVVMLYDLSGPEPQFRKKLLASVVRLVGLRFSPDNKLLAWAGAEGQVLVWEALSGKKIVDQVIPGCNSTLVWAGDSRHLLLGSTKGKVYVLRALDKSDSAAEAVRRPPASIGSRQATSTDWSRDHGLRE